MTYSENDLKQVMADVFRAPVKSITADSSIDTVASWDSLTHLNLILALEERFNVSFTEDETIEMLNYRLIKMTLEGHGASFSK